MSEIKQDNATARFQPETLNELTGGFTGLPKRVAEKILNKDFFEEIKKTLNSYGGKAASDALKKMVKTAAQKTANIIGTKIAVTLTVIVIILAMLTAIVVHLAGGNIMIPIIVSLISIVIIWTITGLVFKLIARKVSDMIFKAIDGKIAQLGKQ